MRWYFDAECSRLAVALSFRIVGCGKLPQVAAARGRAARGKLRQLTATYRGVRVQIGRAATCGNLRQLAVQTAAASCGNLPQDAAKWIRRNPHGILPQDAAGDLTFST